MAKVKLLRGKWMFIRDPHKWEGELRKFVVSYLDTDGRFKKAYARGMASHDINDAIMRGDIYEGP